MLETFLLNIVSWIGNDVPRINARLQFAQKRTDVDAAHLCGKDALLKTEGRGGKGFHSERSEFAASLQSFPGGGDFDDETGGVKVGLETRAEGIETWIHKAVSCEDDEGKGHGRENGVSEAYVERYQMSS